MVSPIGIAVIPSIGECPDRTADLTVQLREENIHVFIVNNLPGLPRKTEISYLHTKMYRQWGIYRTWNFGLRVGARCNLPVLILNDDIIVEPGAAGRLCTELEVGHYGILGFNYDPMRFGRHYEIRDVRGTYKDGGIGGFAFGVSNWLLDRPRVDRRFRWWGGDDDLIATVLDNRAQVGIMPDAVAIHPEPSHTAHRRPELLPEGWAESDRALLIEKWGRAW